MGRDIKMLFRKIFLGFKRNKKKMRNLSLKATMALYLLSLLSRMNEKNPSRVRHCCGTYDLWDFFFFCFQTVASGFTCDERLWQTEKKHFPSVSLNQHHWKHEKCLFVADRFKFNGSCGGRYLTYIFHERSNSFRGRKKKFYLIKASGFIK